MNYKRILPIMTGIVLCTGCGQKQEQVHPETTVDSTVQVEQTVTEEQTTEEMSSEEQSTEIVGNQRPQHDAMPDIEPTKLYDNPSENVKNSKLPRVDIDFTEDDYKISRHQSADALVTIKGLTADIENEPAKINVQGYSTAEAAKRPLKIIFGTEQTIDNKKGTNQYILYANVYDKTLLHNYVAQDLYSYVTGTDNTICEFVDVYSNDSYQGVYTLCNDVTINMFDKDNDIGTSLDKTDYLVEQDFQVYYTDSNNGIEGTDWFWMKDIDESFKVLSPKSSPTHTSYINTYMDNVYEAILEKDWSKVQEYIDVDSFIDGFMVNEIIKNKDSGHTNVYYVKIEDEKLKFAALGDCGLTFGSGDDGEPESELIAENNFLFNALWDIPPFRTAYIEKFAKNYQDYENHMIKTINETTERYKESLENDYTHWESNYNWCTEQMSTMLNYDDQITYMESWIRLRMNYLYGQYNNF